MINRQPTGHAPPRALWSLPSAPLHAGSRAQQRYPPYGPSLSDSSAERYSEAPTDEVRTGPAMSPPLMSKKTITPIVLVSRGGFRLPPRTPRPRRGGILWPFRGWPRSIQRRVRGGGRARPRASETSSWAASPVPAVHRDGVPSMGSRMFEQFAVPPPPVVHPPASVTRMDLHEDPREDFDDRRRRGAPVPPGARYPYPTSQNRQAVAPGPQRHPSNRRQSQQHAYQVCVCSVPLERRTSSFHVRS
jgi:hypothetical protein